MKKQNKNDSEIFGQYASDAALHGKRSSDTTGTLEIRGDGDQGFHQENVYGTAEADIKEGSYAEDIHVRRGLGKAAGFNDDTEAWLQQNDPDYDGKNWD